MSRRRGARGVAALGVALAAGVAAAPPADAADCASWPGEPRPLPTAASDDAIDALWARSRARELAAAAEWLEGQGAEAAAHLVWEHAACLEPERPDFGAARARTAALRLHRPTVLRVPERLLPASEPSEVHALRALAEPVLVASRAPLETAAESAAPVGIVRLPPAAADVATAPPEPGPLVAVDRELDGVQELVRTARFEEALARLEGVRKDLGAFDAESGAPARSARLELLTGTAQLALGREDDARASFVRALAADATLRLDPATTSPKVVTLFEEVRGAGR
jgi:hypothetical protein